MSHVAYVLVLVYALAFVLGAVGGSIVRGWFAMRPPRTVRQQIRAAEDRVADEARAYWLRHITRIQIQAKASEVPHPLKNEIDRCWWCGDDYDTGTHSMEFGCNGKGR